MKLLQRVRKLCGKKEPGSGLPDEDGKPPESVETTQTGLLLNRIPIEILTSIVDFLQDDVSGVCFSLSCKATLMVFGTRVFEAIKENRTRIDRQRLLILTAKDLATHTLCSDALIIVPRRLASWEAKMRGDKEPKKISSRCLRAVTSSRSFTTSAIKGALANPIVNGIMVPLLQLDYREHLKDYRSVCFVFEETYTLLVVKETRLPAWILSIRYQECVYVGETQGRAISSDGADTGAGATSQCCSPYIKMSVDVDSHPSPPCFHSRPLRHARSLQVQLCENYGKWPGDSPIPTVNPILCTDCLTEWQTYRTKLLSGAQLAVITSWKLIGDMKICKTEGCSPKKWESARPPLSHNHTGVIRGVFEGDGVEYRVEDGLTEEDMAILETRRYEENGTNVIATWGWKRK